MDLCQLVSCDVERTFCLCWKTWTDCMIYKVFFLKNKPGVSGVFPPSGLGPDRNRVVMWALRIDLLQAKHLNSLSWALEMSLQAKGKFPSALSKLTRITGNIWKQTHNYYCNITWLVVDLLIHLQDILKGGSSWTKARVLKTGDSMCSSFTVMSVTCETETKNSPD